MFYHKAALQHLRIIREESQKGVIDEPLISKFGIKKKIRMNIKQRLGVFRNPFWLVYINVMTAV